MAQNVEFANPLNHSIESRLGPERVIYRESEFPETIKQFKGGTGGDSLQLPVSMGDEIERSSCHFTGIEQLQRPGGSISRILKHSEPGFFTGVVQFRKFLLRHENFASHFEPRWSGPLQSQRDSGNGPNILRDDIPSCPVASGDREIEMAVAIVECYGDTVDLRFDRDRNFGIPDPFEEPLKKGGQFLFGKHVIDAQHRNFMGSLLEPFDRLSPHSPGRRVGARKLRESSFEKL